jgi:hypothetical protein
MAVKGLMEQEAHPDREAIRVINASGISRVAMVVRMEHPAVKVVRGATEHKDREVVMVEL